MKKTLLKALPFIAIPLVAAIVLFLSGRTLLAPDGSFGFFGDANGPYTSQRLFDPYTLTHVEHGILLFLLFWLLFRNRVSISTRFTMAIGVEALWEIVENSPFIINRYREATFALGYYGDSIVNSMVDILACILGFWLASKLPVWATVAIVIAMELGLLYFIRDNLSLNILLLLFPIASIKQWQLAG